MCSRKLFFTFFCIPIVLGRFVHCVNSKMVSNFPDLLRNLSSCDVQIMYYNNNHNQLSFNDISLVFTTIFMTKYEYINRWATIKGTYPVISYDYHLALDVLRTRISLCRLSFILSTNVTKNISDNSFQYFTANWVKAASNKYLHFTAFLGPWRQYYFIQNTNSVITLIIRKSTVSRIVGLMFEVPLFYYFSVILISRDKNFEMILP